MNTLDLLKATIAQIKTQYGNGANGDLQIPLDELEQRLAADTQTIADLTASGATKGKRGKKSKKERDPNRPKRGKSAFFLWCDDNRKTVKEQIEQEREDDDESKIGVAVVAKRLGAMWKELSDEDKAPYHEAGEVEKATYRESIDTYNSDNGITKTVATKSTFDPALEADVQLPPGWAGPFDGYLEKHPVDSETGKRVSRGFADFHEAFAEAERLGDACGGITLSTNAKGNRRLTLRGAKQVSFKASVQDERLEISYLKPVAEDEDEDDDEMPELEDEMPGEIDWLAPVAVAAVPVAAVSVPIDEDSDEDSDEELEVEDFEHKGVTYQKDQNGMLYTDDDVECETVVGKVTTNSKGKLKVKLN
jgi:hypothetical protein